MPPGFMPKISINEIPTGSERIVARALMDTLDDGWTVFHSYSWLRPGRSLKSTALREGEADFVLFHPDHGLLVVEVKGGRIEYRPETGTWLQGGQPLRDPFDQARRNEHALVSHVRERSQFQTPCPPQGDLPCPYGYAVVFPDCNFEGTLPAGAHPDILAGAADLPCLGQRMLHALQSRGQGVRLPAQDARQVIRALQSTFRLVEALSSKLARDEDKLIQLTEQQAEALEGLYCNRRVLIEGVAGSGKTILGMRRALAFAEEGGRTLFLCFNRRLAEHLDQVAQHPNLTIRHFHRLCHDVCVAGPGGFQVPEEREAQARFWKDEAPMQMFMALDDLPEARFDAIVVDEAQDFQASWWDAVEALLREPGGPLYIFFDRLQNLYGSELQFPAPNATFQLRVNCRNTRRLAKACGCVLGQEMKVSPFSPEGASPQVHRAGSPAAVRQTCTTLLNQLLNEERFPPSRLAILSPYTRQKSPSLGPGLQWHRVTEKHDEWQTDQAVLYSTIRSFKGLEADVVILVDLGDFRPGSFERADLYVAASRAKHRLHVVTDSDKIEEALGVG